VTSPPATPESPGKLHIFNGNNRPVFSRSHGEHTSCPDAADGDGRAKPHVMQTPLEYECRCAECEYREVRESASALLSVLLPAAGVSVRSFFRHFAAVSRGSRTKKAGQRYCCPARGLARWGAFRCGHARATQVALPAQAPLRRRRLPLRRLGRLTGACTAQGLSCRSSPASGVERRIHRDCDGRPELLTNPVVCPASPGTSAAGCQALPQHVQSRGRTAPVSPL
jgi:hypothetical protein